MNARYTPAGIVKLNMRTRLRTCAGQPWDVMDFTRLIFRVKDMRKPFTMPCDDRVRLNVYQG